MAEEQWQPVVGYEGMYMVSNLGRVRSLKLGRRLMKQMKHYKGHLYVFLYKNSLSRKVFVHRMVAAAFIPNPLNLPVVNHLDEVKTNNRSYNLEWTTARENTQYYFRKRREIINQPVMAMA